ncbi:hypothetical protein TcG_08846 [Trypanosoma cruzi]|nr:hypothetical protein TcG_08846 [Trypanosoma cruzi]
MLVGKLLHASPPPVRHATHMSWRISALVTQEDMRGPISGRETFRQTHPSPLWVRRVKYRKRLHIFATPSWHYKNKNKNASLVFLPTPRRQPRLSIASDSCARNHDTSMSAIRAKAAFHDRKKASSKT